jgi:hypothetical protein
LGAFRLTCPSKERFSYRRIVLRSRDSLLRSSSRGYPLALAVIALRSKSRSRLLRWLDRRRYPSAIQCQALLAFVFCLDEALNVPRALQVQLFGWNLLLEKSRGFKCRLLISSVNQTEEAGAEPRGGTESEILTRLFQESPGTFLGWLCIRRRRERNHPSSRDG